MDITIMRSRIPGLHPDRLVGGQQINSSGIQICGYYYVYTSDDIVRVEVRLKLWTMSRNCFLTSFVHQSWEELNYKKTMAQFRYKSSSNLNV